MKEHRRIGKCLACGRKVEWEAWAAGPVCYPCFWGARLFYENGINKVDLIPPELRPQLEAIFLKGGYQWPTELTWSFINRHFDKCNTELLRWWRPDKETEEREEAEYQYILEGK